MIKVINFLKKHPQIYSVVRSLYTPIRNLKNRKKVDFYSNKGIQLLNNCDNTKKNIFYFGVPIHTNLGDLAQYYCIKKWLSNNFEDYEVLSFETYATYSKKFLKKLNTKINQDSIIVFQSGYCTKENHLDHKMHRILVEKFTNNRIIFFPQTINFFNPAELKKTADIYNKHNKITFLARDSISYETAQKNFKTAKILLYPDIVTSLIGTFKIEKCTTKNGLLLCLRNDGEKLFKDELFNSQELKDKYGYIDKCDTNSPYTYCETMENLEKVLQEFITKISKYKVVITDRYHGTIFSLIANTTVIVVPTNDHKVVTGAKWFDGIYNTIILAKDPNDAISIANRLENFEVNNNEYFKNNYYDKLKENVGDFYGYNGDKS